MRPKICTAEALKLGQLEPSWGRNILVQDKRPLVNQFDLRQDKLAWIFRRTATFHHHQPSRLYTSPQREQYR
jgi:hypothetical protein